VSTPSEIHEEDRGLTVKFVVPPGDGIFIRALAHFHCKFYMGLPLKKETALVSDKVAPQYKLLTPL
jgi:hypothetical protein